MKNIFLETKAPPPTKLSVLVQFLIRQTNISLYPSLWKNTSRRVSSILRNVDIIPSLPTNTPKATWNKTQVPFFGKIRRPLNP